MTRLKWRKLVPELVVRPDLLSGYVLVIFWEQIGHIRPSIAAITPRSNLRLWRAVVAWVAMRAGVAIEGA